MAPVVETPLGKLRGVQREGHQLFKGIPFAKPPVGLLRFRPPQRAESWTGERDAADFGPGAPQPAARVVGMESGPKDEACLTLNVFTPAADTRRRPVLFWIHGGGFTLGSSGQALYEGGRLVERGDVVLVTVNYRLGALGYLDLTGVGGDAWGATANAGQLDQIAALEWTRDNVSAFGGDPGNVTIFGESAGAAAVASLLAMPAARGLFHKAIAQSGSAYRIHTSASAKRVAEVFLEEAGVGDAAALRELPAGRIVELQGRTAVRLARETRGRRAGFGPVTDGATIPVRPLDAVRAGDVEEIPLLVGINRDEAKFWRLGAGPPKEIDEAGLVEHVRALLGRHADQASQLIDVYRKARAQAGLAAGNLDVQDAIQTDATMRIPGLRLVEAQRAHQLRTYSYLFSWESPAAGGALGSCHALELPFVFGTLDAPGMPRFAGSGPAAQALAHRMMDAWVAFARTGDPSHEGIGPWPPYDLQRRSTMVFDETTTLVEDPWEETRRPWSTLLP